MPITSAAAAASLYLGDRRLRPGETLPRFVEIVAKAENGDNRSRRTLEQIGDYLGIGIANAVPRAERGTAIGVRLTGNRLAQLILPSLLGTLAGAAGLAALFWTLGAVLAGGALMVLRTPFDDRGAGPVHDGETLASSG